MLVSRILPRNDHFRKILHTSCLTFDKEGNAVRNTAGVIFCPMLTSNL
jgi:hypothetical protein